MNALQIFKKASSRISEMGAFQYKVTIIPFTKEFHNSIIESWTNFGAKLNIQLVQICPTSVVYVNRLQWPWKSRFSNNSQIKRFGEIQSPWHKQEKHNILMCGWNFLIVWTIEKQAIWCVWKCPDDRWDRKMCVSTVTSGKTGKICRARHSVGWSTCLSYRHIITT